jgi:hypothetical protein
MFIILKSLIPKIIINISNVLNVQLQLLEDHSYLKTPGFSNGIGTIEIINFGAHKLIMEINLLSKKDTQVVIELIQLLKVFIGSQKTNSNITCNSLIKNTTDWTNLT